MRLPDAIERDLKAIEDEYASRGGQQAGTPRLRGLRASIEIELQRLARERDEAREFLGRDLKASSERVLTLELECQAAHRSEDAAGEGWRESLAIYEKLHGEHQRMELAAKTFRDATQEAALALMEIFGPLVADAAIVGETYGWSEVLTVARSAGDRLAQHQIALRDYLDWGAMTGSDRDLFESKFRELLAGVPAPVPVPCVECGTTESKDGDWYRLCGECRWTMGARPA